MTKRRILVLIPHPDDEVVACCAAIGRARAEGSEVFALYLTDGCIARKTLWPWQRDHHAKGVKRRKEEAIEAAKLLGLLPLAFLKRPARHLWLQMEDVYKEIKRTLETHAIEEIWVPAYEGGNADHDGLNAIGSVLQKDLKVFEFSEYHFAKGKGHSNIFLEPNDTETVLALSDEEKSLKKKALSLYASEQGNLDYIKTDQETYRPLASYDYTKPPHEGTLWYTRFHWVPFRHPRVDFTRPEEVSASIARFLAASR